MENKMNGTVIEITPEDPMADIDSIKKPQIHRCGFCAFTTRHLPALHSHVASQHKDQELQKPLACKFCSYRTSYRGNLKKHIRIHTGEKPFSCRFCGKRFASKSNHKTHETTHTRMKKIVCPVPKCSTVCNKNELHLHISQNHANEVIQMKFKLPLSPAEMNPQQPLPLTPPQEQSQQPMKMSPPVRGAAPDTPVSCSPSSRDPLQQITQSVAQMPVVFPCTPARLLLPSDALVQNMQSPKSAPMLFPTYGQQPVFPGNVPRWAPEQEEALNLASGSDSGSEPPELKPEIDAYTRSESPEMKDRERRDSGNSTMAGDSPEHCTEREPRNVAADSTSMMSMTEASDFLRQHEASDIIEELARAAGITLNTKALMKETTELDRSQTNRESQDDECDQNMSAEESPEKTAVSPTRKRKLDEYDDEAEQISRIVTALVQSKSDARLVLQELSRQGHLFNCSHCNIFFPEYSTYVLHRSCHDTNTPFTCHFCQASFSEKFGFLTHFMQCAKMKAEKA